MRPSTAFYLSAVVDDGCGARDVVTFARRMDLESKKTEEEGKDEKYWSP